MTRSRRIPFLALLALAACSDNEKSHDQQPPAASGGPAGGGAPAATTADHGTKVDLGTTTIAGRQFGITRLGEIVAGKEGALEVRPKGMSPEDFARLSLYVWVEDKQGEQVSAPSKGSREGDALHFHVTPRAGSTPMRVVLRMRADGVDERAGLPLDGHGHEHKDAPHGGMPAKFKGGAITGHVELKLHDDKGDLELWLAQDEQMKQPFDLPLDAKVEVEFVDVGGRKVTMRARNRERNADENGKPNVRDGKTNYFVYPSEAGEDAAWLKGKEFHSIVVVRFTRDGTAFASEEFVAKPHVH